MNKSLTVSRWFVGILFIFSGLVKANDPLGLSYKMQEFFEAWQLSGFHDYTLGMSILMNAFEIIAGVAVIVGWRMKLFSWLLLLLIVFFTFLTGYAWLATNPDGTAKFASCGCFGDCLPLTPEQSFLKDLLLLVLIGFIFKHRNSIQPMFKKEIMNFIFVLDAAVLSLAFQWFTLKYLPVVDCLPFKKGNNILESQSLNARDPYGLSKIQAEEVVQEWCAKNNVACTILRLPLLVGQNPPGNLGAMIKAIQKGYYMNISGGLARKSMVLAEDVAKIILVASEIGGIYNLTDGYHPNFSELSAYIAQQLNKNKPFNIPTWMANIMAKTGDLFGEKFPFNSYKLAKVTTDLTFDDSKAREILGWHPQPVLQSFKIK